MSGEVVALMAEDGCYELMREGELAARLVWVEQAASEHEKPGWWLDVPGRASESIYLVPPRLARDLLRARQDSVGAALVIAERGGLLLHLHPRTEPVGQDRTRAG